MSNLTSWMWWRAAGNRALRTALVILVPYAPTVIYDGNYLIVLSAAGFGAVSSFATSLFGIAETAGTSVSWYWAVFERATKTAAQALLTAFGTATMFSEVDWGAVPALVGSAVLGSVLLAVLKALPEADTPVAAATLSTTVVNIQGQAVEQSVPVVATVAPEVVDDLPAQAEDTPPAPETPPEPEAPKDTRVRLT